MLLLAHDHRFPSNNGVALNDGRFGDFRRYTSLFDSVTMLARDRPSTYSEWAELDPLAQESIEFLSTSLRHLVRSRSERRRLAQLVKSSNAVVARLPSILGTITAALAKRYRKAVFVEMVGCPWDAYWNHGIVGKLVAPIVYMSTRYRVRKADFVLYVTERFLQQRYPTSADSIACSDVVLPLPDQTVLERRLRRIESKAPDAPIILATAAAVDVAYKGHEYVLKAMANMNVSPGQMQYWLIGGGDQSRLTRLAAKLGLTNNVVFLGALPHDKVLEVLEDSVDIYVQPSRLEGMPRAVLEAMSVGCPVVASRVGGIPELLSEHNTFEAGDIAALTELISGIDENAMRGMARRNFHICSERYDRRTLDTRRQDSLQRFRDLASARESDLS